MKPATGATLAWDDVRFFLATARARTLAGAATTLQVDQTTVGRRITALEGRLGVTLFARTPTGLALSAAGARVLESAEQMEEAALSLSSAALAERTELAGTVRIATSDSLAEHFIVPAVTALSREHKDIRVVLLTGWQQVDLRKGDADVAVRLVRPTDERLARRRLASFALRLYASRTYLAERGAVESLSGQTLIAYEDAIRLHDGDPVKEGARHPFAQLPMHDGRLALLSNNHAVLLAAAVLGLGIVQLPSYVGDAHPALVRVFPTHETPYSVWLVRTQANKSSPLVRAVSTAIARVFSEAASSDEP